MAAFCLFFLVIFIIQSGSNWTNFSRDENGFIWLSNHVDFATPLSCKQENSKQIREESIVSKVCREGKKLIWDFNASVLLNRSGDYLSPSNILQRSVDDLENINCGSDNMLNLNRTLSKILDPKSTVNIYVLGGSMTSGRLVGGYEGAWPRLLNSFLSSKIKPASEVGNRFHVFNRAVSATSSHWALNRLPFLIHPNEDVNLVIIDYDINDCALINDSDESRGAYLSTIEVLIKRLLAYKSNPGVIFLNVAINHHGSILRGTCDMFPTCYSLQDIRAPLMKLYSIPVISQRQAIWEFFDCQPFNHLWPCTKFCSHPWDTAHDLVADLAFGFLSGLSYNSNLAQIEVLRPYTRKEIYADDESLWSNEVTVPRVHPYSMRTNKCANEETSKDAHKSRIQPFFHNRSKILNETLCWNHQTNIESESNLPSEQLIFKTRMKSNKEMMINISSENTSSILTSVNVSSTTSSGNELCWRYMEDIAGKPGWINQGCEDGSIYFRVKFGDTPRINIVYLTSYGPECGKAHFSISNSFEVNPLSQDKEVTSPLDPKLAYTSIGILDSMREKNEWQKHSLSTNHVFCPKSSKINHNTGTTSVSDGLMGLHQYAYLKVKPINPTVVPTAAPSASPTSVDSLTTNNKLSDRGKDVR